MFDYPGRAFRDKIQPLILKSDTVLDIGSGVGAGSLLVAPWCERVIAVEKDKTALQWLETTARERGVRNIETVCTSWPPVEPLRADITLLINVYPVSYSLEGIKSVYDSANRGGFIACNAPLSPDYEPFAELEEKLGIVPVEKDCENLCYVRGVLEAFGAKVTCEQVVYDFSQPLSGFEEVVSYLAWQVRADDSMTPAIREYAKRTYAKVNDKYIVPIRRRSCGIVFMKE